MAGRYLLDTNVISETRKTRADSGVIAFLKEHPAADLFLSVLTLGELHRGVSARRRTDPHGADGLQTWLENLSTAFADQVLPVDHAVARLWGELTARRSLPVVDTLIAATAIAHDMILVTRNSRDIASTGVPHINPWVHK